MSHYKTIQALGTPHVTHQGIVAMLDDFELAVMLSHLMYWADKTDNPLGVYRSNADWYELFRFKEAKAKKLSDELQKRGLITKTHKRLEHRIYYLFNADEFDRQYEQFANLKNDGSPIAKTKIGEAQKSRLADSENQGSLYTKINTKNTYKDYSKESEYAPTHESQQTHFADEKNSQDPSANKPTGKTSSAKKSTTAKKYLTADDLVNLTLADCKFTQKDFENYPNLGEWIFADMDYQVASDYLVMRGKSELTLTAIKMSIKEASIAGLTLCQALEVCITSGKSGWLTFKAQWYANRQQKPTWQPPQPPSRMDELRHMAMTNPTNIYVNDLPDFDNSANSTNFIGVSYE